MSNSKPLPPLKLREYFPSPTERALYKTYNKVENRVYPIGPVPFAASLAAATALHTRFPENPLLSLLPDTGNKYLEAAKIGVVSFATVYTPVVILRAFLKYFYFSYKGFMFENPKKPSITTKIWAVWRKMLSLAPPRLLSCDSLLPNLPVPVLEDTVAKYLQSMKHILSKDEYTVVAEQADTFLKEEGKKLQMYTKMFSWTTDNYVTGFWEKYAYLYGKECLLINSSVAHVDLFQVQPATQAYRAAHVAYVECMSQLAIDDQSFKPPGEGMVCSRHYEKLYAITREPGEDCDRLVKHGIQSHIVILSKGGLYRLDLCNPKTRKMFSIEQLAVLIEDILAKPAVEGPARDVAALTTDRRDEWARNRRRFFLSHPRNAETLKHVETAAFCISLDEQEFTSDHEKDQAGFNRYMGSMITGSGTNRWVDKSFNYTVSKNGRMGGTTEHSIADGAEFDHAMENFIKIDTDFMRYPPLEEQRNISLSSEQLSELVPAQLLPVEVDDVMSSEISRCVSTYGEARDDVDLCTTIFKTFGKGLIKKFGCSPDAFIQMAIQLANYRDQGKFSLTYEATSARFFANSRTETLRSVTEESCAFVHGMMDEGVDRAERARLLRTACATHAANNRGCIVGRGIDRHLFVLYIMSKGTGISSPFLDHYISQKWILSTSHIPNMTQSMDEDKYPENSWLGASFGAVAKNGYGMCYRTAGNHSICMHITSYKSAENTDSTRMRDHFVRALCEMRDLFDL